MIREDEHSPLDAALPHEPERSHAQVRGVLERLGDSPKRILELGCGHGRLVVPLAERGHHVTGLERDPSAIAACRNVLSEAAGRADLIETDFLQWTSDATRAATFDAILCVGNTFMTIADLDEAVQLLANVNRLLAPAGCFILDDLPHDLWPQLTEGNWTAGVSEDGAMQLVWHPDDAVFTIRRGNRVNPDSWTLDDRDERYRLWTSGALRLAARLAGLSEPLHRPLEGLLVLRRNDRPRGASHESP